MLFLIAVTGWGARLVLVLLVGLSLWSVAIMLEKRKALRSVGGGKDLEEAKALIRSKNWAGLTAWVGNRESLPAGTLRTALESGTRSPSQIDRSVKSYLAEQKTYYERGLTVLATLGSNAPFLGLFGTVLGIIQAFGVLASSPSGTSSVMWALAEALVATAVGLLVAIPAVVAFNIFSRKLKIALVECEAIRDFYLSRREASGGEA